MKTIWFVHGAGASNRSFKWIKENLPPHIPMMFSYTLADSLNDSILKLNNEIDNYGKPAIIIGHSLGGLIAAGVAPNRFINGVITMCAPFGGLPSATFMMMVSQDQLYRDLSPYNASLSIIRKGLEKSNKPFLPIVASSGLPISKEENDGVVPLKSQKAIIGDFRTLQVNHFEVLLSNETIDYISDFMRKNDE